MNHADQLLHDALTDLADDVLPAPLGSRSTSGRPSRSDPWERARRHRRVRRTAWLAGGLAAGLVGVLVLQAGSVGFLARPVQPVAVPSGPGSLPDRIFPTRSSILSVAQAPLGRAALVYTGPALVGGVPSDRAVRPIAVGADTDAYRSLPLADTYALAPDGRVVAYLAPAPVGGYVPAALHLIDLSNGKVRLVPLPDRGHGLAASQSTLFWSPDSRRLLVEVYAQGPPDGNTDGGAHQRFELVDVAKGTATWREGDGSAVLGWSGSDALSVEAGQPAVGIMIPGTLFLVDPATGVERQRLGRDTVLGRSGFGTGAQTFLSPDGAHVAGPYLANDAGGFTSVAVVATASGAASMLAPAWMGKNLGGFGPAGAGRSISGAIRPVGWASSTSVVVAGQWQYQGDPSSPTNFSVDALALGGGSSTLLRAGADAQVRDVQIAADVLAGARIRRAAPPSQPPYDARTLLPAATDWIGRHAGWSVALLVLLVAAVGLVSRRQLRKAAEAPTVGD